MLYAVAVCCSCILYPVCCSCMLGMLLDAPTHPSRYIPPQPPPPPPPSPTHATTLTQRVLPTLNLGYSSNSPHPPPYPGSTQNPPLVKRKPFPPPPPPCFVTAQTLRSIFLTWFELRSLPPAQVVRRCCSFPDHSCETLPRPAPRVFWPCPLRSRFWPCPLPSCFWPCPLCSLKLHTGQATAAWQHSRVVHRNKPPVYILHTKLSDLCPT